MTLVILDLEGRLLPGLVGSKHLKNLPSDLQLQNVSLHVNTPHSLLGDPDDDV